jgi:hypothetical protein
MYNVPTMDRLDVVANVEGITLSFMARPAVDYSVETSANLATWTTVTNVTGTGATVQLPLNANGSAFYRLR